MKAFIVKLGELLKLNTGDQDGNKNFDAAKRCLKIPKYQREFKWTDEKITAFINDIKVREKFIGNIILDEVQDCYEIVDGQQRLTTCYLTIICLYNFYRRHQREQDRLNGFLRPYGDQFVLKNDSIGNYILQNGGTLNLEFSASDVYFQKSDFERAMKKINDLLTDVDKAEFIGKLLDCQILVLINNEHQYSRPVEQLFLDINEKAQLLDVEDIFKGHCFENYSDDAFHEDLRNLWVELKKCGMGFKKFGFEDLSEYIYLFLLLKVNPDMPEKLTINGKHYLDGKTMDETESVLKDMKKFGSDIITFERNICNNEYRFVDLCADADRFRTTEDHLSLKRMCAEILNSTAKAKYQKLPFMNLVSFLLSDSNSNLFNYDQFRKTITNLYIFSYLFILNTGRKSKKDIDQTLRVALDAAPFNATDVMLSAKNLRIEKVENFSFSCIKGFNPLTFIYSIIDNYSANNNWLSKRYSQECGYNCEHFLIPNQRSPKITWVLENNENDFQIRQSIVAANKKKITNYLVMDRNLNESLDRKDIIEKIRLIRTWYQVRDTAMPVHISKIIEFIVAMPSYINLETQKRNGTIHVDIAESYCEFLEEYFSNESQAALCVILEECFKSSFEN